MSNYVKFLDAVELVPLGITKEVKDFYGQDPNVAKSKPLRIRIAATHAGKVTRNNGFYLPHKMKDGASSFIAQYPKPIQVHHNDDVDPIGRVVAAAYIDTSNNFRTAIKNKTLKDYVKPIDLKLLDSFIDGKKSPTSLVDIAITHFIRDSKLVDDPNYEGLGYIELLADITDPEAVQKVLDGRYLTGSTGASTNRAVCSVCKQDWASEGKCDHTPGRMYDEMKCVLIAGDLTYDEYSFVNRPADRHSRVIEVNINGIQDFVTIEQQSDIIVLDSAEEGNKMTFKDAYEVISSDEKFKGVEDLADKVKQLVDSHTDLTKENAVSLMDELLNPKPAEEPAVVITDETSVDPIQVFFGDSYNDVVGDDTWGKKYAEMLKTYCDSVPETEREVVTKEILDAKLTAEQRKGMSSSTFCGPDRSYPVPDCNHAKSAMAYAKKYNESSSVMSCIRRKAARLGCPMEEQKDSVTPDPFGTYTVEYFDRFEDSEIEQFKNGLIASMQERKLDCGCLGSDDSAKLKELEKTLSSTKPEENVAQQLDNAKKEIKYLHTDIENLTNVVADAALESRVAYVNHIRDLRRLSGETVEIEAISAELKDKATDDIRGILKDLMGKVDISKIAGKLSSGLTNPNPVGAVESPVLVVDNMNPDIKKFDNKVVTQVRFEWLRLNHSRGRVAADKFLADCKEKGLIPADLVLIKE